MATMDRAEVLFGVSDSSVRLPSEFLNSVTDWLWVRTEIDTLVDAVDRRRGQSHQSSNKLSLFPLTENPKRSFNLGPFCGCYTLAMTDCKNCDTPVNDKYCPHCGQRVDDLKRPIWSLVGQLVHETLEFDGRAARTVTALMWRPGKLTADYLAGRRVTYTPPLRLYLVFSVVFFVIMAWALRAGLFIQVSQGSETFDSQLSFVGDDLPKLVFVLLPGFAALLKLAFRHRLYFEHLIHALHLHTMAYVFLAVLIPLERAATDHWAFMVIQISALGAMVTYMVLSVKRVYRATWPATLVKTLLLLLGYAVFLSGAIAILSSLTGIPL